MKTMYKYSLSSIIEVFFYRHHIYSWAFCSKWNLFTDNIFSRTFHDFVKFNDISGNWKINLLSSRMRVNPVLTNFLIKHILILSREWTFSYRCQPFAFMSVSHQPFKGTFHFKLNILSCICARSKSEPTNCLGCHLHNRDIIWRQ